MNTNTMKTVARDTTAALLTDILNANDAVQFADGSWAILQTVNGQEIWTEITVKSKAWTPTTRTEAFDLFVTAEAWKADKAIKAKEKAEKDKAKAEKVAKAKAKKDKAE